jgi:hypothetical protein
VKIGCTMPLNHPEPQISRITQTMIQGVSEARISDGVGRKKALVEASLNAEPMHFFEWGPVRAEHFGFLQPRGADRWTRPFALLQSAHCASD